MSMKTVWAVSPAPRGNCLMIPFCSTMKIRLTSPGGAVTNSGPLVPAVMPLATVTRVRLVLETGDTPLHDD